MHEGIPIHQFPGAQGVHARERQADRRALREGARRVYDAKGRRKLVPDRRARRAHGMRRRAGRGRPGERLSLDRARRRHRVRQLGHAGASIRSRCSRPIRRSSSAATRRSGPRTSSGRWRTATRRRSRSTCCCHGEDVRERPPPLVNLVSQKMGIHEWSYDNDVVARPALQGAACRERDRAQGREDRGRARLRPRARLSEAQRCLNCDVQTVFSATLCIECDACVDICPMDCITFTANGDGGRSARRG